MKKKVLSLALASAFVGVAGTSHAALTITDNGIGHILYVPYFSTQDGNTTLLNLINTDVVRGKAVKIRFRSAYDSDDLYDFQVFLSPGDVWTANISQAASGRSKLTTEDNSCVLPVKETLNAGEFATFRLDPALSASAANSHTREGYIEILNMADIVQDYPTSAPPVGDAQLDSLFFQIKHKNGVAPCNINVIGDIEGNALRWDTNAGTATGTDGVGITVTNNTFSELAFVGHNGTDSFFLAQEVLNNALVAVTPDLTNPTATLAANWTIINIPKAAAYGAGAVAINATTGAFPTANTDQYAVDIARIVYSNQTNVGLTGTNGPIPGNIFPFVSATADGVLLSDSDAGGNNFAMFHNDIPDLSTPYGISHDTAVEQADALSNALLTNVVGNEYLTLDLASMETDWVISMPTRRYHVAGRGRVADGVAATGVTGFYNPVDKGGPTGPFRNPNFGQQDVTEYDANGRGAKIKLKEGAYQYWDREERKPGTNTGIVISPTPPTDVKVVRLPGEVSVVGINQGSSNKVSRVLGAEVTYTNLELDAGYIEGWAALDLTHASNGWSGLPVLGQAFVSAFHPKANATTSGNYGANWSHRYNQNRNGTHTSTAVVTETTVTTFREERACAVFNATSTDHPVACDK